MINHVVLFKLKDYPEDQKPTIIKEMKLLLEGLKGKIEELRYLEVGVNYELNAKSYDIVLISHLNFHIQRSVGDLAATFISFENGYRSCLTNYLFQY